VEGDCPKCGGPNPPSATVCQWCSSSLVGLPPPVVVQAPPKVVYVTPPEDDREDHQGRWIVVGVVVFIVLVVLIAAAYSSSPSSPASSGGTTIVWQLGGFHVVSPDNACGLNGDDSVSINYPGGVGNPVVSWTLPGPGGSIPCTVTNVTTNTSGFQLSGNLPYTVTSDPGIISLSVNGPSDYPGIVNVTFT